MKRKILLLASIGVVSLSLVSCNSESYRDRDFNVSVEKRDSSATIEYKTYVEVSKLIDEDFEYNPNSSLYTTREALFDNYKSVMLSYNYSAKYENLELETKQRTVYDFETGKIYFHQYQNRTNEGVKHSYEIETFAEKDKNNDNGYYKIISTIKVDNFNNYSGIAKISTRAPLWEEGYKDSIKEVCGKTSLGHNSNCVAYSNESKDYTYFEGNDTANDLKMHMIVVNRNNLFSSGLYEIKRINGDERTTVIKNNYYDKSIINEEINTEGYKEVPAMIYKHLARSLPLTSDNNYSTWLEADLDEFISSLDVDLDEFLNEFFKK